MSDKLLREKHINRHNTHVKIFDYIYEVRVNYHSYRTIDDIKRFGTPISGIKQIDESVNSEKVKVAISIAKMLESYDRGVDLNICKEKDVKEIYESISEHIQAWKEIISYAINVRDAPIEDLILMDKFAVSVYEHAKYQFIGAELNSILGNQLVNLQTVGVTNFFTGQLPAGYIDNNRVTRINADEPDERESFADFFKSKLIHTRKG